MGGEDSPVQCVTSEETGGSLIVHADASKRIERAKAGTEAEKAGGQPGLAGTASPHGSRLLTVVLTKAPGVRSRAYALSLALDQEWRNRLQSVVRVPAIMLTSLGPDAGFLRASEKGGSTAADPHRMGHPRAGLGSVCVDWRITRSQPTGVSR